MSEADIFENIYAALNELLQTNTLEVALATPVLLSPNRHALLRSADDSKALGDVLDRLVQVAEVIREKPWPAGAGPLDKLFVMVQKGELAKTRALALAGAPDRVWRLSEDYVARMSLIAEVWARNGKWRDGVLMARLVTNALEARHALFEFEQSSMEFVATVRWLDVVTRALSDIPDPSLFHDAVARGEKLAGVIEDTVNRFAPASILHALGLLHLDSYFGGRSNGIEERRVQGRRISVRAASNARAVSSASRLERILSDRHD